MASDMSALVLLSLGDEEARIELVVTGRWQPSPESLPDPDVLAAELRGESELGPVRAKTLLLGWDLENLESLAGELLAGNAPRTAGASNAPDGGTVWASNDRDSRLVLTFHRRDEGLVCTMAEMTGIHGWPGFRIPVEEPAEVVGEALLAGVRRVRLAYPA